MARLYQEFLNCYTLITFLNFILILAIYFFKYVFIIFFCARSIMPMIFCRKCFNFSHKEQASALVASHAHHEWLRILHIPPAGHVKVIAFSQ